MAVGPRWSLQSLLHIRKVTLLTEAVPAKAVTTSCSFEYRTKMSIHTRENWRDRNACTNGIVSLLQSQQPMLLLPKRRIDYTGSGSIKSTADSLHEMGRQITTL